MSSEVHLTSSSLLFSSQSPHLYVSALYVLISGDFHTFVRIKGLPVAPLKRSAELLSRADLVGVREPLPLHPLEDLMQSLLPLHRRHQLLHQLFAQVVFVHVALAVHIGVHVDLRTTNLNRKENSLLDEVLFYSSCTVFPRVVSI